MGGFAWVTLATNDSYSLGALVLAHSLKQVGTRHQLAVLITPGVTSSMRTKLGEVFNVVQEVNILDSKDESNLRLLKRPELGVTFTKLHCWRLTQFDKCGFLDADTLVLENCDELFDREELSAAPDIGWPDCFNSGVFIYSPSNDTYEKLVQFALEKGSFDGGDQGLLNLYFSDWAHKDISKHLPFIYNMASTACYSYLPAFKQFGGGAKIIHFIGTSKPWLQYFDTETKQVYPSQGYEHLKAILQHWWNIFCSCIHPHLSPDMAGIAGAFANLTLGQPRTPEQLALDDHLRRQGWEVGNIDYLGRDSFDNIWNKICETLSSGPAPPPTNAKDPSTPRSEVKPAEQPASAEVKTVIKPSSEPVTQSEVTQHSAIESKREAAKPVEVPKEVEVESQFAQQASAVTEEIPKTLQEKISTTESPKSASELLEDLGAQKLTAEILQAVENSKIAEPPKSASTQPKSVAELSKTVVEPSKSIAEPVKSIVEPPKPIAQPPKSVAEPPKPVPEPPKSITESPKLVTEASKPVAEPPKPVVEPRKPVDEPPKSPAETLKSPAKPPKLATESIKPISKPVEEQESPASVAKLSKSIEKPSKLAAEPSKMSVESTKAVAEPTKAIIDPSKLEPSKVVTELSKFATEIPKNITAPHKPTLQGSKSVPDVVKPTAQPSKPTAVAKPETEKSIPEAFSPIVCPVKAKTSMPSEELKDSEKKLTSKKLKEPPKAEAIEATTPTSPSPPLKQTKQVLGGEAGVSDTSSVVQESLSTGPTPPPRKGSAGAKKTVTKNKK